MSSDEERAREISAGFAQRFDASPDGVWAAPGRVNLIGEHTDYNDGFALPFGLDRSTFAAVRRRDDDVVRVATTGGFDPVETRLGAVGPGQVDGWTAYPLGVLWALLQDGQRLSGLDILVSSTVPTGAGLSSSAALSCSVALSVQELYGLALDRTALAAAARRAENEVAGAPTGPMDQLASLHAVADAAVLIDCRSLEVRAVRLGLDGAGLALLVIDTKAQHALNDGAYADRRAACERAAKALGVPALRDATLADLERAASVLDPVDARRARHIVTEDDRVLEVVRLLDDGHVERIGPLLDASHVSLRDDLEVSCRELDAAVEAAQGAGALGARMTGGGFGGSAVALVPADAVDAVGDAVRARFAADGFAEPEVFAVEPGEGAHRVC